MSVDSGAAAVFTDRAITIGSGAALIAFVCAMAARAPYLTGVIERYYARRAEHETAKGWMGRTIVLPGRRTSLALLMLLFAVPFAAGVYAIVLAVSG